MPKPHIFSYEKRIPFRDAYFFIIVCEGTNREPDYFNFFVGLSSRVKIIPVKTGGAPRNLIEIALEKENELQIDDDVDKLWFVIDTDRWRDHLHDLRTESNNHKNWKVAQSNPCFEVWLYYHVKNILPDLEKIEICSSWKPFLNAIVNGGFNPDVHPIVIQTAIENSKAVYEAIGYFPKIGCTQVWQLAEEMFPLISKDLEDIKHKFPPPIVKE